MARRLEKIEKELGYCEIKLEKEKRLRKHIRFVEETLVGLDTLLEYLGQFDVAVLRPNQLEGSDRPSRETFMASGLVQLLAEKKGLFLREREELVSKLKHFSGFEEKKRLLENEKRELMQSLSANRLARLRQINDEFKKIEKSWNELTEDLINLDEGIFALERNLDYLKSCRNFLISAKGNYDFEFGRPDGFLMDLFRHSSIGRAVEMADGADRNLQAAHKNLVCVSNPGFKLKREVFVSILVPFMDALYEDLFVENRLDRSIQVVEAALAANLKLLEQIRGKRDALGDKLDETERSRNQVFQRMGSRRRSEMTA